MAKLDLAKQLEALNTDAVDEESDFEEILSTARAPANETGRIVQLPIDQLVEYTDDHFERITGRPQPFKAYNEERLTSLAKSIAEHGVIDPITVRPLPDGRYQILAGRNRKRASVLCGKESIPAIIRSDIDDYQAAMILLDTNLERRPDLTYSEKAYAYRMRVELQRQQGKRTDLDGGERIDSLGEAGKEHRDSRRTVAYLIRLTYLLPGLLELVDAGQIGFKLGVDISYLSLDTQELLLSEIIPLGIKLQKGAIHRLRELDETGQVHPETIHRVFRKPEKPAVTSITIQNPQLADFADLLTDRPTLEKLFLEFLHTYRQRTLCTRCTKS